jgi:hypothetical protein
MNWFDERLFDLVLVAILLNVAMIICYIPDIKQKVPSPNPCTQEQIINTPKNQEDKNAI